MAPAESKMAYQELSERVKQYEGKIATLTVINGALQNENDELRGDLEAAGAPQTDAEEELLELKEEFARRLGSAEKAIATLKDERDGLRAAAAMASQGGSLSEARLQDREHLVDSLQKEGEALSRRNGELEATVRKLRAAARDVNAERERLAARIHTLESQVQKEREAGARVADEAAGAVEDLEAELAAVRLAAAKQVSEARREAAVAAESASVAASRGGEEALTLANQRLQDLTTNIQDLRAEMEDAAAAGAEREDALRREAMRAEEKLRAAEMAVADLASNAGDSTKPLLRQIEAMAAAAAGQQAAAAEAEARLLSRALSAEAACSTAWDAERTARGQAAVMEASAAAAHGAGSTAARDAAEARQRCEAERRRALALEAERDSLEERLAAARQLADQERKALESTARDWQEQAYADQERVRSLTAELQTLKDSTATAAGFPANGTEFIQSGPNLPTGFPDGRSECPSKADDAVIASATVIASAHKSSLGAAEDIDLMLRTMGDGSGPLPLTQTGHYHSLPSGGSMQRKESARVALLEDQVRAAELARDAANNELLRVASRAAASEAAAQCCGQLQEDLKEGKRRLQICLELLGERNERIEQLEDDIAEMKIIFRSQLSLAADQLDVMQRGATEH